MDQVCIHIVDCGHWNFCPSCVVFMCVWRFSFLVALNSHCGHWNFCPSCTDFMCIFMFPFSLKVDPQRGHRNFSVTWNDFTCSLRIDFAVALYSHCKHLWLLWSILKTWIWLINGLKISILKYIPKLKGMRKQRLAAFNKILANCFLGTGDMGTSCSDTCRHNINTISTQIYRKIL